MDQSETPDGYMRNAQGHLVPLELVKPIDQERDRLVRELVDVAKDLNARLIAGKAKMFGDVATWRRGGVCRVERRAVRCEARRREGQHHTAYLRRCLQAADRHSRERHVR